MNKRHVIALIVGIVLLAVPILSCVPKQTATPVATDSLAKLSDLEAAKKTLSEETAKKADKENVLTKEAADNLIVEALKGYTKTDDLEKWLSDHKYQPVATPDEDNETGEYGTLVDSDGDLQLWVDKISPGSSPYSEYGANDDMLYIGRLTVVNTDEDNRHSFDLSLFITPDDDCTVSDNSTCHTQLTTNGDEFSGFVPVKDLSSSYNIKADYEFEFRTSGHGSIKAGGYTRYSVTLDLCQKAPTNYDVYWDWEWEITDRD